MVEFKNNQSEETEKDLEDLLSNPFSESTLDSEIQPLPSKNSIKDSVKKEESIYFNLSTKRKNQAEELAKKINVTDSDSVLNYGQDAQKQLTDFSHSMLTHVQNQETGAIGETLNDLMFHLQEANPSDLKADDRNLFKKLFGKISRSIYETTAKYQKIGAQVDKISLKLSKEKDLLLDDNKMLEGLYQKNLEYFDALNVYIAAGELKINEIIDEILPKAVNKAETSTNQMDIQRVNDLNQFLDRLEKRVYDLKIAKQMTIQQAPQIRLIQNTNQVLSEKIQTSINTAIPLWKNQIAVALTLLRQKEAVTAQRQVSETTNDLLLKNSEMLKQSSIETARENERGIIDIETLQKTQSSLVETLEETLSIQKEGRMKRIEAERELVTMENNLRDQLLKLTTEDK
ncbi:toxic anion resistance protein [Lacticigenium naphthae]|uniref:toxic anion resistance protein n=1 Tax=Lacticigenium naphthae TaxID=515351 RepID=UPI0004169E7C|nr:toxic anion resistance protein [Lacticigenium naphthae]